MARGHGSQVILGTAASGGRTGKGSKGKCESSGNQRQQVPKSTTSRPHLGWACVSEEVRCPPRRPGDAHRLLWGEGPRHGSRDPPRRVRLRLKLTRRPAPRSVVDVGEPGLRSWEMEAELLGLEVAENNPAPLLAAVPASLSAERGLGMWMLGARCSLHFVFIVTWRARAGRERRGGTVQGILGLWLLPRSVVGAAVWAEDCNVVLFRLLYPVDDKRSVLSAGHRAGPGTCIRAVLSVDSCLRCPKCGW